MVQTVCIILSLILAAALVLETVILLREKKGGGNDIKKLQTSIEDVQQSASKNFEQMARLAREEQQRAFQAQTDLLNTLGTQTRDMLDTQGKYTREQLDAVLQGDAQKLSSIEAMVKSDLQTSREAQKAAFQSQSDLLSSLSQETKSTLDGQGKQTEERMRTFSLENAQRLSAIEGTVRDNLALLREDQNKQLNEMRNVVDEKMQKVLNERMQQAFGAVNERLEQVYKGLGEMQTLAGSVGDLKKILTNVKSRGEIGEVQLEAILTDMLPENSFLRNAKMGQGTVEFAIRLPDANGGESLLPVDAKFPGDTYEKLETAYEHGDKKEIEKAQQELQKRIREEAKDISTKYVSAAESTNFGILFLPTEGLYTEVVRMGQMDSIFKEYRIFITGPTTMAAMITTIRFCFQSIAVQKQSQKMLDVVRDLQNEFQKYVDEVLKVQKKLQDAESAMSKLISQRISPMQRRLEAAQDFTNVLPEKPLLQSDPAESPDL